jgi:hypothetical protein
MTLRKTAWRLAAIVSMAVIVYSCSKDNSSSQAPLKANQQRLNVYFTDGPGVFDNVFLDIKKVEVLVDTCGKDNTPDWGNDYQRCWWGEDRNDNKNRNDSCQVWDSLAVTPGTYDVLALRNGADTLLGNGVVPKGDVEKIVLTLGTGSYLVKDSVQYPLKSPNGQVRLEINIRPKEWEEYESGNYRLWLDFDVERSIVQTGNGQFILRPVIHVFLLSNTGSIAGKVTPNEATPVITIYNNQDTAYALPARDGSYQVRGLTVGDYSLFVNASNGYKDTTVTGVSVERAKTTTVKTIRLTK